MEDKTENDCHAINGNFTSKALTYTSFWNLKVSDIVISTDIKDDEILVRVKAVSINPIDILLHRLSIFFVGNRTKVLGGDYSGVVVKAGPQSGYEIGDSIFGYRLNPFSINGTYSQYIVINPKKVIFCHKIPKGMIFEQAASLSCACATGYGVIKLALTKGNINESKNDFKGALKGKRIFIIGAGTSVGSYAVEIAKKYMNADRVVVTCSSRSEHRLQTSGADLTIDYTLGNLNNLNEVLQMVKNEGKFDIIVDCIRNESYLDYLNVILKSPKEGGAYSQVYGTYQLNLFNTSIISFILPSYQYLKHTIMYRLGQSEYPIYRFKLGYDKTFANVVDDLWNNSSLDTPIDSIFRGWTQYNLALHRVATAKASGKVVCIL